MRIFLVLAMALLPATTVAQDHLDNCLAQNNSGSRISGRVVYDEYQHPGRPEITITGYKLVLLQPVCYEIISGETGEPIRGDLDEVAINDWNGAIEFARTHLGQLAVIRGQLVSIPSPYYVAPTQIYAESIGLCQMAPMTGDWEKC